MKEGHDVQVLTGYPSYPYGKIYKGYEQKFFYREILEGVEVIRVPIYPNQGNRAFGRVLNYMSFALTAIMFGIWRVRRPDVVFVYHGALPVGMPAIFLKFFRRVPFVYDINDLWPDTLVATNMLRNKYLLGFINKWCNLTYRCADHITVLSKGFKDKLIERGVSEDKISVIYHWSRDKQVSNPSLESSVSKLYSPDKFHVLYAGNVGIAQSLQSLIRAFCILQEHNSNFLFTILGDGVQRKGLKLLVEELGVKNVRFLDRVNSENVGYHLRSADVLLVHLRDEPLFRITIPSKIIGYMLAGKPILLGLKGDAQNIIEDSKSGDGK